MCYSGMNVVNLWELKFIHLYRRTLTVTQLSSTVVPQCAVSCLEFTRILRKWTSEFWDKRDETVSLGIYFNARIRICGLKYKNAPIRIYLFIYQQNTENTENTFITLFSKYCILIKITLFLDDISKFFKVHIPQ